MSWPINNLRTHCVSRPEVEYFARFFNGYSDLQPHCVSRGLPVDSAQGIRGQRRRPRFPLPDQTAPQPVLPVVVRVAPSPTAARAPVTLVLAARVTADVRVLSAGVRSPRRSRAALGFRTFGGCSAGGRAPRAVVIPADQDGGAASVARRSRASVKFHGIQAAGSRSTASACRWSATR